MSANKLAWPHESIADSVNGSVRRAVSVLLVALRVTLYAVLAVLRPFIVHRPVGNDSRGVRAVACFMACSCTVRISRPASF